jgi:hypothetical protein
LNDALATSAHYLGEDERAAELAALDAEGEEGPRGCRTTCSGSRSQADGTAERDLAATTAAYRETF